MEHGSLGVLSGYSQKNELCSSGVVPYSSQSSWQRGGVWRAPPGAPPPDSPPGGLQEEGRSEAELLPTRELVFGSSCICVCENVHGVLA